MRRTALAMLACVFAAGCAVASTDSRDASASKWQSLSDGSAQWRSVGKDARDPRWTITGDAITLTAAGGGDILTDATYGDFELEFEWMLPTGGNSGLFYRAAEADPIWARAVEYQLLDDAAAEDRFDPSHRAGAVYDLIAPSADIAKPANAYNRARVVACGSRVEHWLNGQRVAMYDTQDASWRAKVAGSKFAKQPEFAIARSGHIGVQDHGNTVHIRHMRIRVLVNGCAP